MATSMQNKSDFNWFWAGQTISTMGDRITRIALPTIAVLSLHGGVFQVGVISALGSLPFLLFGLIVGVWTDRLPKRSIMIAADFGRMGVLALVPIAYEAHFLSEGLLYAVAGVTATLSVFFNVAYQSYLPYLVGQEGVVEGQQKLSISGSGATFVGSGIAGVLMQALGNALAVAVDSASFVASVVSLLIVRHREPAQERAERGNGVLADMREGLGVFMRDVRLRFLLLTTTLSDLATAIAATLIIVYGYKDAGLNQGEVSATFAAGAIGLTLGGVFARKISARLTVSGTLMGSVVLIGAAIVLVPVAGTRLALVALTVCQFLIGVGTTVYGVNVMGLVLTMLPREVLGRANGTALTVIWGTATFGGMIAAVLGGLLGVRTALVVAGVAGAAAGLFIALTPSLRAIRELPGKSGPPPAENDEKAGGGGKGMQASLSEG
jgi:MFS family permease